LATDGYNDLYGRAQRAIAGRSLDTIMARTRAIVGPPLADLEGDAQDGLEALKKGRKPTANQVAALQAVVRSMRPSVLSRQGSVDRLPDEAAPVFPAWPAFVRTIVRYLYTIGRVDHVGQGALPAEPFGTGFLISPDLFLTNHHVVTLLTGGTDVVNPAEAEVRFVQEFGAPDEPAVPVLGVHSFHEEHDAAILRLAADQRLQCRPPLKWSEASPEIGDQVVVLGYPSPDGARNPLFAATIFGGKLNVKRLAPGELIGSRQGTVYHDCSTLGGNSGSPVVDIKSGTVVGLHRDGYFLARNEAVWAEGLRDFVRG
jgi:S1-C subfamily serine protease